MEPKKIIPIIHPLPPSFSKPAPLPQPPEIKTEPSGPSLPGFSLTKNSSFLPIFLYTSFLILSSVSIHAEKLPFFSDNKNPGKLAKQIIRNMTDIEILGQTLMFGYQGEKPDSYLLEWIEEKKLGAVKIFGRNANNLSRLTRTIAVYQEKSRKSRFGIPLLIATDQEGGLVRHIRGETSITAGNMAIGADGLPYSALQAGRLIGKELNEIGINMNFAPTVDIFLNPDSDLIGTRSFGQEPNQVGILGLAFAKGQQEYGVIATAKHFPGHGDTAVDSHKTLPIVNATINTLKKRDLIPYQLMIKEKIPAIMVGHLAFPQITGNLTPATLSYRLLTLLLRQEMNFQGVIITDDLHMYGVRNDGKSMDDVAYEAMMAGSDLLLLSSSGQERNLMYNRLLEEMKNNPAFIARVNDAALRILKLKIQWLKKRPPDNSSPTFGSPPPETHLNTSDKPPTDLLLQQAARSITLIRNKKFPLPPFKAGKVLLIGDYKYFFSEGLKRYPNAKIQVIAHSSENTSQKLLSTSQNFDSIIVLLSNKNMTRIMNTLSPLADRVIILSIFSPAPLADLPWVQTSLALYGATEKTFRSAFATLAGDFRPQGRLPITLNKNGKK